MAKLKPRKRKSDSGPAVSCDPAAHEGPAPDPKDRAAYQRWIAVRHARIRRLREAAGEIADPRNALLPDEDPQKQRYLAFLARLQ
jgi:hypothetical protein